MATTTTRVKDIPTTATTAASDDYFVIDGATNGTRKYDHNADAAAHGMPYLPTVRNGLVVAYHFAATEVNASDQITKWLDVSGNENHLTARNPAYGFVRRANLAEGPKTSDGSENQNYGYSFARPLVLDKRSSTVLVCVATSTLGAQRNRTWEVLLQGSPILGHFRRGNLLASFNNAPAVVPSSGVVAVSCGADATTVYSGGEVLSYSAQEAGSETYTRIFANDLGQNAWMGDVVSVLIFDRALSAWEVERIENELDSHCGDSIVVLGDSIAFGAHAELQGQAWPVACAVSTSRRLINYSMPSATLADFMSDSNVACARSLSRPCTVVVALGTNDLAAGATASALETNLQAFVTTIRAQYAGKQNVRIAVATVMNRTAGFSGSATAESFATQQASFNTWLRANYTSFANILLDFAAVSVGGYTDGVHPDSTRHAALGVCAATALVA